MRSFACVCAALLASCQLSPGSDGFVARVPRPTRPPPAAPPPPARPPAASVTGYEKAQQRPVVQQPPIGKDASGNVKVPNLFRMTKDQAEATLRRYGFERGVSIDTSMCGSVMDGKIVEKGEVCYQSPPPGNVTSPKVPVRIRIQDESPYGGTLHGDRKWFLMPDMIGWPVDKALARMKEVGFLKEVKIGYTKDCAANTVCKSLPEQLTRGDNTSDKLFYVGQP